VPDLRAAERASGRRRHHAVGPDPGAARDGGVPTRPWADRGGHARGRLFV